MIEQPRSSRRKNILPQIGFLALTFLAAACGTYVALQLFGDESDQSDVPEIITVEIIITATPLPPKLVTAVPTGAQRPQLICPSALPKKRQPKPRRPLTPMLCARASSSPPQPPLLALSHPSSRKTASIMPC